MAGGSLVGSLWGCQERHFIVGARPTQDPIALRKAPEANDGCLVHPCKVRPAVIAKWLDQSHGKGLMFPILAVLEGQVDEISLRGCHSQIKPVCDELLGQATRELIRGEGAR